MSNNTFLTVLGVLSVVSIISCIILNQNRRIPHTASMQDDPCGSLSDLLVFISFIFVSLFLVISIFDKMNISQCNKVIKEQASSKDPNRMGEIKFCTELLKEKH